MNSRECQLQLKAVFPHEVDKIISELKNKSSCGLDTIDAKIIKLGKSQLLPAITHIVNLSITTQTFPEIWKVAKVIPLDKKKDSMDPENYRPVSLLSTVSKILERSIFLQMVKYFEENNLIDSSHHGFQSGHNTATALIKMIDKWVESFDQGNISAVVALDMSAAFDLVNKSILLDKLEAYRVNTDTLK